MNELSKVPGDQRCTRSSSGARDDVNARRHRHDGGREGARGAAQALALLALTLLVLRVPALTIQQ